MTTTFAREGFALVKRETYEYNDAHQITRITHANGKTTEMEWICSGPLSVTDEDGITTQYEYNSAKRCKYMRKSAIPVHPAFSADSSLELPPVTYEYFHDPMGEDAGSRMTQGEATSVVRTEYDTAGRVIRETDAMGLVTRTSYSADGLETTVTLPTGATLVTRRHSDGRLLYEKGTGQENRFYTYEITPRGMQVSIRLGEPDGVLAEQCLEDGLGRVIESRKPGGDGGWVTTVSRYNGKGQLVRMETTGRAPMVIDYDEMGQVRSTALVFNGGSTPDPSADQVTEWEYEYVLESGIWDGQEREFPFLRKTRREYAADGTPVTSSELQLVGSRLHGSVVHARREIDAHGHSTVSTREKRAGNVLDTVSIQTMDRPETHLYLDDVLIVKKNCEGGREEYRYSFTPSGTTMHVTGPRGEVTSVTYNLNGQETRSVDEEGYETRMLYHAGTGLPSTMIMPFDKRINYQYDARGRKTSESGAAARPARYVYDDADRLIALYTFRTPSNANPAVRADGDVTRWIYDESSGVLKEKIHADGSAVRWRYDDAGRVLRMELAEGGRFVTYSYDSPYTQSPTRIRYSDSTPDTVMEYDHLGRLVRVEDAAGVRTVQYSPQGDMLRENLSGAVDVDIRYDYDPHGRYAGYSLMRDGAVLQRQELGYDPAGRPGSVVLDDLAPVAYAYHEGLMSSLKRLDLPFGITKTRELEERRSLASEIRHRDSAGGTLDVQYMHHIPTGQVGGFTRWTADGYCDHIYDYNDSRELIRASMESVRGPELQEYSYDGSGNRQSCLTAAGRVQYGHNALNQTTLVQSPASSFEPEYDRDGNQTRLKTDTGEWEVVYNADSRPSAFIQGATRVECRYDAQGRRTSKKVLESGAVVSELHYTYAGYQLVAEWEMRAEGPVLRKTFQWNPADPLETTPLSMTLWEEGEKRDFLYLHDFNKNINSLVDASGHVVARYEYDPYGNIRQADGELAGLNPFRYSSEYHDDETGLVCFNYRYYNPADGKWISRDPAGEAHCMNLYAMVDNNLPTYFDILGLSGWSNLAKGCRRWMLRRLVQDHHIIPRKVFKKLRLEEIGFRGEKRSNLIPLPKKGVKIGNRSNHQGFTKSHREYSDYIEDKINNIIDMKISNAEKLNEIHKLRDALRQDLRTGKINLAPPKHGCLMIGPFLLVEAGSLADDYFKELDRYEAALAEHEEIKTFSNPAQYGTAGKYTDSWVGMGIDFFNPLEDISFLTDLTQDTLYGPSAPKMPEELKEYFNSLPDAK